MKQPTLVIAFVSLLLTELSAQFDSGSNESFGPILVNNGTGNQTLDLPPDGIFHCTTITIEDSRTLRFRPNANNTPVYLLASGDVSIDGKIIVSGLSGNTVSGGQGGPGGFAGGNPASESTEPGDGYGPGAGKAGTNSRNEDSAGSGGFARKSTVGLSVNHGEAYGNALLIPLVGGSGGGGTTGNPGFGGGGGGGAILVASNTRIQFFDGADEIIARGGVSDGTVLAGGSGGAIRLVAPLIVGDGDLSVVGGEEAGAGRIRIDTLNRAALELGFFPQGVASIGSLMAVFPDPLPRLDVTNAAGTDVAIGSGPVNVLLPFGSPSAQTITVQARDFGVEVPIRVTLTPDNGASSSVDATIDNLSANPASVTVPVEIPANVNTAIHVWTR